MIVEAGVIAVVTLPSGLCVAPWQVNVQVFVLRL